MLRRISAMLIAASGVFFSASTVSEVTIQPVEPVEPAAPPALGPPSMVTSEVTVQPSYEPDAPPIQYGFFGTALSEVLGQPDEAQQRALVAAPSEPAPRG